MPAMPSCSVLPPGWSVQPLSVLGSRQPAGEPTFRLGRAPLIRAVRLPGLGTSLLVCNQIKDIRFYTGIPSQWRMHLPRHQGDAGPDDWAPLGQSATPFPSDYRYAAVLADPSGKQNDWALLIYHRLSGRMTLSRGIAAGNTIDLHWPGPLECNPGLPEAIDWSRDGVSDLLLARPDGTVHLHLRDRTRTDIAFDPVGQPVLAAGQPIRFSGLSHVNVVDWTGDGRRDLLLGTQAGHVYLFADVGGPDQVAYARGYQLVGEDGPVCVHGSASPTLWDDGRQRLLLVADGNGAVWSWPLTTTQTLVTTDLAAAVASGGTVVHPQYRCGAWWTAKPTLSGAAVLCAAPVEPPARPAHRYEPTTYDPPAPECRLNLPTRGRYEIHVTLVRPDGWSRPSCIAARLSDETTSVVLQAGEKGRPGRETVFFKTADVTGKQLCLSQLVGAFDIEGAFPAWIESVRLVPVAAQTQPAKAKSLSSDAFPVAAILDTFMWFKHLRVQTQQDMDELIGRHRDSGFHRIYYKLGGGSWEYPSGVPGAQGAVPAEPCYTDDDRRYGQKLIAMLAQTNRLAMAIDACRRQGLECFGWMRVQNHGEHLSPHARYTVDRFYLDHPQYLEKNPLGQPVAGKLCLGYPEVRAFLAAIAAEAVTLGVDGVMIDTLRQLPKVMWGDPVVEEFRREHGLDMRQLPPFDARVVELQCRVMGRFLAEVRRAIHQVNPHAQLHVRVGAADALMGCDPERWAREGLIDAAIIEHRGMTAQEADIQGLVHVLHGSACKPIASFARAYWDDEPWPLHPDKVAQVVDFYRRHGSQGVAFYETAEVIVHADLRRAIRRINDPAEPYSRLCC